jgi:fumarate hydratase subunit beta
MKRSKNIKGVIQVKTPIDDALIQTLKIGDKIEIHGKIYCGRDAALPKLARLSREQLLNRIGIDLRGSVIFHTAVSPAGIGPTTSNKVEIEGSIPALSKAGVKIHLGKGSLSKETAMALKEDHALFAVTPPVSALFASRIVKQKVAAFPEEGMEALYEVEVEEFPAIVAIAEGQTIFSCDG